MSQNNGLSILHLMFPIEGLWRFGFLRKQLKFQKSRQFPIATSLYIANNVMRQSPGIDFQKKHPTLRLERRLAMHGHAWSRMMCRGLPNPTRIYIQGLSRIIVTRGPAVEAHHSCVEVEHFRETRRNLMTSMNLRRVQLNLPQLAGKVLHDLCCGQQKA